MLFTWILEGLRALNDLLKPTSRDSLVSIGCGMQGVVGCNELWRGGGGGGGGGGGAGVGVQGV